jgi:hypothetical protein
MGGQQSKFAWVERILLVLAAAGAASAWLFTYPTMDGTADFNVFYQAAKHWRTAYDASGGLPEYMRNGRSPFAYPPTFLFLAWPFAQFDFVPAYIAWSAGSFALFVLAASFLHLRAAWLLVVTPFLVLLSFGFGVPVVYQPILYGVMTGQTAFWTGAGLIAGGLLLDKRPAWAGVILALVACIKPTAALAAPFVLIGRWRGFFAAGLTGVGVALASLAFGPDRWVEWVSAVGKFGGGKLQLQPSVLMPGPLWATLLGALGVVYALRERNVTGLLVGTILMSPYLMPYDLSALCALGAAWVANLLRQPFLALVGVALLAGLVAAPLPLLVALIVIVGSTLLRPQAAQLMTIQTTPLGGASSRRKP